MLRHPGDCTDLYDTVEDAPEPTPAHGYGTRRSTQVARPAYALGLHKRTQAEIHAEAEKKRAEQETKKQVKARKLQRMADGVRELARLEDERILADAEEDRYLNSSLTQYEAQEDLLKDRNNQQHEGAASASMDVDDVPGPYLRSVVHLDEGNSAELGAEDDSVPVSRPNSRCGHALTQILDGR